MSAFIERQRQEQALLSICQLQSHPSRSRCGYLKSPSSSPLPPPTQPPSFSPLLAPTDSRSRPPQVPSSLAVTLLCLTLTLPDGHETRLRSGSVSLFSVHGCDNTSFDFWSDLLLFDYDEDCLVELEMFSSPATLTTHIGILDTAFCELPGCIILLMSLFGFGLILD